MKNLETTQIDGEKMEKAKWSRLVPDNQVYHSWTQSGVRTLFRWGSSVTQQHTDEKSEPNHEWSQPWWVHAGWISGESPKQKQRKPLRKQEGGGCSPVLPKVIVTCCGVCSSLVPRHIFSTGLRSKTINSLLIICLHFKFMIQPSSTGRRLLRNNKSWFLFR